jgi:hypothetical protein
MKINVEFGKMWVTNLKENYEFEIDDNFSYFMYTCDTSETKKIYIGRTGEGFQAGKHEKIYC